MVEMAVRTKFRHVVKPAEATPNEILPLSELDQSGVITHSSHLHFYNKPTQDHWLDPSQNNILNTLKDSLSRALVPFYPLAGRLCPLGGGRFEVVCNAMGAELIDGESDMTLSDFGDFYSRSHLFRDLLPEMDYDEKSIQELPVFAAQITQLKCGGLSLGMSVSHLLVDGRSAFHFAQEWATLALGQPLQNAPFLDRRVLGAGEPRKPPAHDGELALKYTYNNFYPDESEKVEFGEQVTPTFVTFTSAEIEKLKVVANSNRDITNEQRRPYSRFEAISGYLWRCMTKARELKNDDETTFITCVDSRGRLEPPLPISYLGNAIVDVDASSEAGELISKPLSYACSKVREAIEKATTEFVFEKIEFIKRKESLAGHQYFDERGRVQGPSYGNQNVMVVSWMNLRDPGVDFGWGKDVHTGPPVVYACDGDIMISHCKEDGSVIVGVVLRNKQKFIDTLGCTIE